MRAAVILALAASLVVPATPVAAQDVNPGVILARVCLPYAMRASSFEKSISTARDLEFSRPRGSAPLDEWASEVELVSRDGIWRVKLEEGTITEDDVDVYAVSCSLSSTRASATELSRLIDRALRTDPRWIPGDTARWLRSRSSNETSLLIDVKEQEGQRPVLSATGLYR